MLAIVLCISVTLCLVGLCYRWPRTIPKQEGPDMKKFRTVIVSTHSDDDSAQAIKHEVADAITSVLTAVDTIDVEVLNGETPLEIKARISQGGDADDPADTNWYATLVHPNGNILFTSEGYENKSSAVHAIETVTRRPIQVTVEY